MGGARVVSQDLINNCIELQSCISSFRFVVEEL